MKIARVLILVLMIVGLSACGTKATNEKGEVVGKQVQVDSDHQARYANNVFLQFDTNVYTLRVRIEAMESLTRQVVPASGSVSGFSSGGIGAVGGSFTGAVIDGKGILRASVLESNSALAPVGSVIILKSVDTKALALVPGDVVTFKCRHQEEVVDAIVRYQMVDDRTSISTWEIDGCKMVAPAIISTQTPH